MSATKVMTFPRRRPLDEWVPQYLRDNPEIEATRALPFIYSRLGSYTHRVRSVTLRPAENRWSADCWCGQMFHSKLARLVAEPHPDRIVCGTCQGRAIGAGQIDDEGTPLVFAPRADHRLGRCCWMSTGYGWNGYPHRCNRHAAAVVDDIPFCREHERRWPITVGWRIEAMREFAQPSTVTHREDRTT